MKKHTKSIIVVLLVGLVLFIGPTRAQAPDEEPLGVYAASPTSGFTYQGYLEENGKPAAGTFDFRFTLWDAETAGNEIDILSGVPDPTTAVDVEDGLFTFHLAPDTLSLQQLFTGEDRWIQVEVRVSGTGAYEALPRQPISVVPYAAALRPGAVISGTTGGGVVTVRNSHLSGSALKGETATGIALHGEAETITGYGVIGTQAGYSVADVSAWYESGGYFGGRIGVIGATKNNNGFAVFGRNLADSSGWAGAFSAANGNGVLISTNSGQVGLTVNGGTKNAAVETEEGTRLLYTEESTEVWFTDYGFGELQNGVAVLAVDALFAQTVNLEEPYHVFVQPYGDAALYVEERTPTEFTVRAREGSGDVAFSYRVVAKRLGYEQDRLAPAPDLQPPIPAGETP